MVFDAGIKPLATIAWAESEAAAKSVQSFRQEYIQCLDCSHVWNHLFDWEHVPYGSKPNKMFNNGSQWKMHIEYLQRWLVDRIPVEPTVVDVGCGDGSFIITMANQFEGHGQFLGFDPSGDVDPEQKAIAFNKALFLPFEDTAKYQPDLIIMRHVIEHLITPSSFLHSLAWGAASHEKSTYLYCEVPCIDRVFETGRLADFYYEHPSQFTTLSFTRMLNRAGKVVDIHHVYDCEVICGLVELCPSPQQFEIDKSAGVYFSNISSSLEVIAQQLSELVNAGKTLAIWGGTGKCAAFMHHYNVSSDDIPIVVDSDQRKWGTYVPGVGQEIRSPSILLEQPVDVLIIPAQWRAQDILLEAATMSLSFANVLIEHDGVLTDFLSGDHPYSKDKLGLVN
jgi:SAM-dependent methyltransferase